MKQKMMRRIGDRAQDPLRWQVDEITARYVSVPRAAPSANRSHTRGLGKRLRDRDFRRNASWLVVVGVLARSIAATPTRQRHELSGARSGRGMSDVAQQRALSPSARGLIVSWREARG